MRINLRYKYLVCSSLNSSHDPTFIFMYIKYVYIKITFECGISHFSCWNPINIPTTCFFPNLLDLLVGFKVNILLLEYFKPQLESKSPLWMFFDGLFEPLLSNDSRGYSLYIVKIYRLLSVMPCLFFK